MSDRTELDYDLLLAFMSERRHGNWESFRSAVSWLQVDSRAVHEVAWIAARRLEDLGHAEFAWNSGKDWCIAPTTLTLLPRSGGRAFLTGSRPRDLYDVSSQSGRLDELCDEVQLFAEPIGQPRGPSTVLLSLAQPSQARELAQALSIRFTFNVADDIAALLPDLAQYLATGARKELPIGFDFEHFDVDTLEFVEAYSKDLPGLYRSKTYGDVVHAINDYRSAAKGDGKWLRVPREYAVYEVLRWDAINVLAFSYEHHTLWVPTSCGLPSLHSRAATLCSGRLPTLDFDFKHPEPRVTRCIKYMNVPRRIAERIADSLSQNLVHVDGD